MFVTLALDVRGRIHDPNTLPAGKQPHPHTHYIERWMESIDYLDTVVQGHVSKSVLAQGILKKPTELTEERLLAHNKTNMILNTNIC
jgi:hypothetical protein